MQSHRRVLKGAAALALAVLLLSVAAQGQVAPAPAPGPPAVAPSPNTCLPGTGSRNWCGDGRPGTQAKLAGPTDVTTAADGTVYVADTQNNVIRRILPDGTIETVAGDGIPDGMRSPEPAASASFDRPSGVAVEANGGLLIADAGNAAIRRVAPDGLVTVVVGGPGAVLARLVQPVDVAVLPDGGFLIVDRGQQVVLRVLPTGGVLRVAGTGRPGFTRRPLRGSRSPLRAPVQVAPLPDGDMLIADGNRAVRWLRRGRLLTLARNLPRPLNGVASSGGRVPVSDAVGVHAARGGSRRTERVAGTGRRGWSGDVGAATDIALDTPRQIAPAPDGTLLIAEEGSDRIRRLRVGQLVTVAGTDTPLPSSVVPAVRARASARQACFEDRPRFQVFTTLPLSEALRGSRRRVTLRIATSRNVRVRLRLERNGRVKRTKLLRRVSQRGSRRVVLPARYARARYALHMSGRPLDGPDRGLRCHARAVIIR